MCPVRKGSVRGNVREKITKNRKLLTSDIVIVWIHKMFIKKLLLQYKFNKYICLVVVLVNGNVHVLTLSN